MGDIAATPFERLIARRPSESYSHRARHLQDVLDQFYLEFPTISVLDVRNSLRRPNVGPVDGYGIANEHVDFVFGRPIDEFAAIWRQYDQNRFWQINYLRHKNGVVIMTFKRGRKCSMSDNGRIQLYLGYIARAKP